MIAPELSIAESFCAGVVGQEMAQKPTALKLLTRSLVVVIPLSLLALGSWVSLNINTSNHQRYQAAVAHSVQPVPSALKPAPAIVATYTVAADLPRYLDIPKLQVHARVLPVGLTHSGNIGTPANVYDTAWYNRSAKPGQVGATVIDGHISSWTTHGVFYRLNQLVAGDMITVQRGDGTVLSYRVAKVQTYDADTMDMATASQPVRSGDSGLNLITCAGDVVPGTSEFSKRLVVFAESSR